MATLLLGLAAQRHALGHAFDAMHAPAQQDAWLGHTQACDQCLQFAAADAAAVACAVPALPALGPTPQPACSQQVRRAQRFTAYVSRAPPSGG